MGHCVQDWAASYSHGRGRINHPYSLQVHISGVALSPDGMTPSPAISDGEELILGDSGRSLKGRAGGREGGACAPISPHAQSLGEFANCKDKQDGRREKR